MLTRQLKVIVSIPDRVLGIFRRNFKLGVKIEPKWVSIPDRVLGIFRLFVQLCDRTIPSKFQSLIGF